MMDDLISRGALLDAIDHERKLLIERDQYGAEHVVVHHARKIIEELPAVDAVPVEWMREKIKEHTDEDGWQDYLANSFGLCIEAWQEEQEAR